MNEYAALVEWQWQWKNEVLEHKPVPMPGHPLHHKSHMNWPGTEPRPMQLQVMNCLSYDTATALVDTSVPFMYLSSQYCYNNLSFLPALYVLHPFKQLIWQYHYLSASTSSTAKNHVFVS